MFNKKLHFIIIIVFAVLGSSLSVKGEIFNIPYLIGIRNQFAYGFWVGFLLIVLIAMIVVLVCKYININHSFYTYVYYSDLEKAEKLINKYYNQNKTLFFGQRLFLAFSLKDKETIRELYNNCRKNTKNRVVCETYMCFLDFLCKKLEIVSIDALIEKNIKFKNNENICYLLEAIRYFLLNDFEFSKLYCEKISTNYYYPCIKEIVFRIQSIDRDGVA